MSYTSLSSSFVSETTPLLSTWNLITLTIALAGAQLTWTVEMSFGTPFLLTLGLSKQSISLVWLAGPLSGLLVQPIVGALSDASKPRWRRRFWIILATFLIVTSTLVVGFAPDLGQAIEMLLVKIGGDKWVGVGGKWKVGFAVVGFWILDFSLNGCQAALRCLILDQSPSSQMSDSNAWQGRFTQLANVIGYTIGYIDLSTSPLLAWIGGGQFRRLAVLSCVVLIITVGITCGTQHEGLDADEDEEENEKDVGILSIFKGVKEGIRTLPIEVKRVCIVQFFAWTGFFPFLFYSTTYIGQTLIYNTPEGQEPPTRDEATRLGSLALLFYAFIALISGSLLPLLPHLGTDHPILLKLPYSLRMVLLSHLNLRSIWTGSLLWFAGCMLSTFYVSGVFGAMAIVALTGVSWAVACWVPFALVMEAIQTATPPEPVVPETPSPTVSEGSPLLQRTASGRHLPMRPKYHHRQSTSISISAPLNRSEENFEAGGTILGIHNLAIVVPQFGVSLVATAIFAALDGKDLGKPDVVWVLRYGGVAALLGAVATLWLKPAPSEKKYISALKRGPRGTVFRTGDEEADDTDDDDL